MYTISKDFTFDAAHQLTKLPPDHKCARLHGHTYTVRVELVADHTDENDMVWDYANLDGFKRWIDDHLDHRNLNEVTRLENPTAELLARYCAFHVPTLPPHVTLSGVGVSETPKTWAWWRP